MNNLLPVFKALSDRNRLRVFAALTVKKELCACQITELLQVTGATASRHMGVLISAGLVNSRKEGRWVYYFLSGEDASFEAVMDWMTLEFEQDPDLRKDREHLAEITACEPEELCRRQRGVDCCPEN